MLTEEFENLHLHGRDEVNVYKEVTRISHSIKSNFIVSVSMTSNVWYHVHLPQINQPDFNK